MTNLVLLISALAFTVAGLIGTYFGYKTFKLYLALVGFVAGFFFGLNILGAGDPASLTIALLLGCIAGLLSYFVYKFALFLALTYLGAVAGTWFLQAGGSSQELTISSPISVIIGLVVGIVLMALKIDKPLIAIATSLIGSYYIVIGVAIVVDILGISKLTTTAITIGNQQHLNQLVGQAMLLITSNLFFTIIFGFFALTGIFFQLRKWLPH